MKQILIILLGVITLNSCSISEEEKVKNVATSFLDALSEKDFEGASKYCDASTKQLLVSINEMIESYGGNLDNLPNMEYKITSVGVNENEANVTYVDGDGNQEQLYLVKNDGEWQISIDKEDLNKEEMDKEE